MVLGETRTFEVLEGQQQVGQHLLRTSRPILIGITDLLEVVFDSLICAFQRRLGRRLELLRLGTVSAVLGARGLDVELHRAVALEARRVARQQCLQGLLSATKKRKQAPKKPC